MRLGRVRTYDPAPYKIALIHGGPGACGTLEPVAQELSKRNVGVLEPFQSAASVDGEIEELPQQIEQYATGPLTLLGHSWGALLALLTAARYPHLTHNVILVGSALLDGRLAPSIVERRLARLSKEEQAEYLALAASMNSDSLQRIGELAYQADSFDPVEVPIDSSHFQLSLYDAVWPEVVSLRTSGALLKEAAQYKGALMIVHGDYDPHPIAGIRDPLLGIFPDLRYYELAQCGHTPWVERQAAAKFYELVMAELK